MDTPSKLDEVRILIDLGGIEEKPNEENHEKCSQGDGVVVSTKDKKWESAERLSSKENKDISDFLNAIEKPSEKFDLKKEFYTEPIPTRSWHLFHKLAEADFRHRSGVFPRNWEPLGPASSSGLGRHKSQNKLQKIKNDPLSLSDGVTIEASDKGMNEQQQSQQQQQQQQQEEEMDQKDLYLRGLDSFNVNGSSGMVDRIAEPSLDSRRPSEDDSKRGFPRQINQSGQPTKVAFFLGADDLETNESSEARVPSETVATPSKSSRIGRRRGSRHKSGSRVFGSEVLLESARHALSGNGNHDDDSRRELDDVHLDVMASHRFDNAKGLRHRKVDKKSFASRRDLEFKSDRRLLAVDLPESPTIPEEDDTHHKVFVELDELRLNEDNELEWRERARWIKYEEEVEEGARRWGKPHVSSLSFHSLVELRRCIERGAVILDLDAEDLPTIASRIVDQLVITDQLSEEKKPYLLQTLLLKHKLELGQNNMQSLSSDAEVTLKLLEEGDHQPHQSHQPHQLQHHPQPHHHHHHHQPSMKESKTVDVRDKGAQEEIEVELDLDESQQCVPALCGMDRGTMTHNSSSKSLPPSPSTSSPFGFGARKFSTEVPNILKRIPVGAEAANVLVGPAPFLDGPVTVFVRLKNSVCLNTITEVPLPVRFLFLLLGPDEDNSLDYHEIGRSLSTLMADGNFHDATYVAKSKSDILDSLNEFLNDSVVLPRGEWDKKTLLPIVNIAKEKQREKEMKKKEKKKVKHAKEPPAYDPLKRTGRYFGGLLEDAKHRYPAYWSDIKDGLNIQCLAAFFFVYFACLSPAITFGGLLGEKTDKMMGVNEMLVATAICGVVFSLGAGQPLVIIGATGPVLVFEEALFKICHVFDLEFLPFRVWVSIWVSIITLFGVMWECSILVRFITRFTEEVFALLISLIFIYEVFKKLFYVFHKNPLLEFYPPPSSSHDGLLCSLLAEPNGQNFTIMDGNWTHSILQPNVVPLPYLDDGLKNTTEIHSYGNLSSLDDLGLICKISEDQGIPHPNTALLSVILTFGTFLLAYALKNFRNSKFLGRNARRAIGDFGVPISIFIAALTDYFIPNTYSEKLDVPEGFSPTAPSKRSWFVNPLGVETSLPLWAILAAAIPSVLIFILLYMESVITSMIINKKDRCLKKGSGYHLDLFVTGMCATICGFLGLPFMCSATVRSVTHVSALSVFSRTHAPGDKPHLIRVHEQRLTSLAVHLLVGVSVMMGPVLSKVPTAVLFGIFLYMGIASMSGIQLLKRLKLMFMPVKHHPDVGYVKKVRLWKMNLFTSLQLIFLAVLWAVKSSKGALAFPFILILIIPVRIHLFKFLFTELELHELDNEDDCTGDDEQDEPDFYTQAHMPM